MDHNLPETIISFRKEGDSYICSCNGSSIEFSPSGLIIRSTGSIEIHTPKININWVETESE